MRHKLWLLGISLLLILFALSSCSSPADNGDTSAESEETETVSQEAEDAEGSQAITLTSSCAMADIYLGSGLGDGCTIIGASRSVVLTLPPIVELQGDLTLKNLTLSGNGATIYANGHTLLIDATVSSQSGSRFTVYGGSNKYPLNQDTHITLLGGSYTAVYGGGRFFDVNGNTHVIFGGNANLGDTNDDSAESMSPCTVYGGGNNGAVTGETHVTISGNAVAKFVSGVGSGVAGGKVKTANITIDGGKLMNVFGGSLNAEVSNLTVNITMKNGLCEAIFGGCQNKNMTGTVNITLLGGNISRRLYTGCYNTCDVGLFSETWKSSCGVTGTTTLSIGPNVKLCTGTGLSLDNSADMGIFCGSRYQSKLTGETNILVFLDDCYSQMISQIGPSSKSWIDICQSHHDQIIKR